MVPESKEAGAPMGSDHRLFDFEACAKRGSGCQKSQLRRGPGALDRSNARNPHRRVGYSRGMEQQIGQYAALNTGAAHHLERRPDNEAQTLKG